MALLQNQSFTPTFSSQTSVTLSAGLVPPQLGNSVVIVYGSQGFPLNVTSITDNLGNTFSVIKQVEGTSSNAAIFWCPSVAFTGSGTYAVTINFSSSGSASGRSPSINITEAPNLTGFVDQLGFGTPAASTGQTLTTGSANTYSGDLVYAVCATAYAGVVTQTITGPSGGYTALFATEPTGGGVAQMAAYNYDTGSPTDSTTYSWPNSAASSWVIVSLPVGLPALPESFAFNLEPATFALGGATSLALSRLTFTYSPQTMTLASAASLSALHLAYGYTLKPATLNFSSANYEILAAPLPWFFDIDPSLSGYQSFNTPIHWSYAVQSTAGPYSPLPYLLGLPYQSAEQVLAQYGFDDVQIDFAYDVVNPPGIVFAQSPVAGTPWPTVSVVTLVVSQGPYVPPTKQTLSGYKVTSRNFSLEEMVSREWGSSFRAPDHRIYNFTGRSFDSTDIGTTGIYQRGVENAALPLPAGTIQLPNGDFLLPNGQIIVPGAPPPGGN